MLIPENVGGNNSTKGEKKSKLLYFYYPKNFIANILICFFLFFFFFLANICMCTLRHLKNKNNKTPNKFICFIWEFFFEGQKSNQISLPNKEIYYRGNNY